MEEYECRQGKQKRNRTNPTKKWNVAEEKALLEFLLENSEIEKPTAQEYYKRFAETKRVPVQWKLARSKVRNMRVSYSKAKAWESSTAAGNMEEETLKKTLIKMCSFFYELDDIFGSRIANAALIQDSLESESHNSFNSTEIEFEDNTAVTPECLHHFDIFPSTSHEDRYSRTATMSDIMQIQLDMVTLKKQKMDKDLCMKERELDIKEKEVALKAKEIALKEKELRSHEKLKILELEMKERVAMEELKLKYK